MYVETGSFCSFEQAKMVYLLSEMSEECVFSKFFRELDKESRVSIYRKLAKTVHPDKNKHPEATRAFQKILVAYEKACI